jgi:uncharacterized membrane protein
VDREVRVELEFSTARSLGLWGSIAVVAGYLLSFIPVLNLLGLILTPVGFMLVLVALYGLSKVYGDRGIFWNALGAAVAIVLSWILIFVFLVAFVLGVLGAMADAQEAVKAMARAIAFALILLMVIVPASALLWYRALRALSARSGVGTFRLSAILYAVSAVVFVAGLLLLVVLVGIIIVLVAEILSLVSFILLALGFSSLKPPVTPAPSESMKPT